MRGEASQPTPATSRTHQSLWSLFAQLLALVLVLAGLLFLPAGRLDWVQGWVFILTYTAFGVFYGAWTLRHDPGQLEERMQLGANTKAWDRFILASYTLLLIGMLVLCGLDGGRFHWAPVPLGLEALGWLVSLFSAVLIWWTSSVNTFMSRTVRIQDERGQQVITSGPYAQVRHPMYLGLIVFMIGIPLILGSGWGLVLAALIGVLIIVRTALEDRTLQQELPGYSEYAQRVRYRLFPWVWRAGGCTPGEAGVKYRGMRGDRCSSIWRHCGGPQRHHRSRAADRATPYLSGRPSGKIPGPPAKECGRRWHNCNPRGHSVRIEGGPGRPLHKRPAVDVFASRTRRVRFSLSGPAAGIGAWLIPRAGAKRGGTMRAWTMLGAILPLTSILVACGPSGPATGPSQVPPTSTPVEVSAPTVMPSPAPTSTKAPTPTPAECEVVAVANTTVYERPGPSSPVFGTMSSGDTAPVGGWTTNGWLGFEPGVAQAANMGVFRLRWVENTSSIQLQGPCSKVPVEPWVPTVGVCYDMAMADTAVHYLATTGSVVLATMQPGDFAAVTGVTSTGFARVDLLRGFPQRSIKGWIQSSDLNMNSLCASLPTISPSAR